MNIPTLGQPRFKSAHQQTVSDDVRIPQLMEIGAEPGLEFELAGPRSQIYFDPTQTRAGIVTCGGLCPGLNNVIRSLFLELRFGYGVSEILGFRGGYSGLEPDSDEDPVCLTPEYVHDIHQRGGTILGTSRGPIDIPKAVDHLMQRGIKILFTVGGDGTQRGGYAIYQEATRRGHPLAVVGVPKTIDNDVGFVSQTFGFSTAVDEACRVLDCAHTEARSVPNGIGLVKLMGRHAGFITAGATIANQDVNFALIPEIPFTLDGERGFLAALKARMQHRAHAVIAVAEGAGQDLLQNDGTETDASGNVKLKDIGVYLRNRIENYFKAEGITIRMRYFDPSYQVRSRPANCEDSILCDFFARNAVHAAMAGKTGVVIGYLHDRFIHIPVELLTTHVKRLDTTGGWWNSVLAATGQPARFQ